MALILGFLVREKINDIKYKSRVESNLTTTSAQVSTYELKNKQLVSSQKTIEVSNRELKRQIWVKDDSLKLLVKQFKKVKAAIKIEQVVKIDSIPIPYEVPVPFDFTRDFKSFFEEIVT